MTKEQEAKEKHLAELRKKRDECFKWYEYYEQIIMQLTKSKDG